MLTFVVYCIIFCIASFYVFKLLEYFIFRRRQYIH